MKNLDPTKTYAVDKMYIYYDANPEYEDVGWFATFDYLMSCKNEPMPFKALPQALRHIFLKICEEKNIPTFDDYLDSELDNLD